MWGLHSSSTGTMVRHRCQKVCHRKGVENGRFDYSCSPILRVGEAESNKAQAGDAEKRCRCRTDFLGLFVDREGEGRTRRGSDSGTYCMADNEHGLYHRQISNVPMLWKFDESGRWRMNWRALRMSRRVGGQGLSLELAPRLLPDSVGVDACKGLQIEHTSKRLNDCFTKSKLRYAGCTMLSYGKESLKGCCSGRVGASS